MLYDITPPISERLAVWPGDTPVSRRVLLDLRRGDSVTLSTLEATVHLGAHADAPSHYGADGPSIEAVDLDTYLGPCQVIRLDVARGERIGTAALERAILAPRVLFWTGTVADRTVFPTDFAAFAPEAVSMLHDRGVRLIGIDTPSVDPFESKELPAHRRFLEHGMAILEGLALDGVPEGIYELIALPLRLVGFDASPVRAVLRGLDP